MRAETPGQTADRIHHHLDPHSRQSVDVAIVERWNHLFLESAVERFRIAAIGDLVRHVLCSVPDREAVGSVEIRQFDRGWEAAQSTKNDMDGAFLDSAWRVVIRNVPLPN